MPQRNSYTPENVGAAIAASRTWADVIRHFQLSQSGASRAHLQRLAARWSIDTSHFVGQAWSRGTARRETLPAAAILVLGDRIRPVIQLRRALLEIGRQHICEECGVLPVWNDKPLVLQVDHCNGNRFDNRPENLRFLCPNCHSQTDTFGVANSLTLGRKARSCCDCGCRISRSALRCRSCSQKGLHLKIDWPSETVLVGMVNATSYSAVGRALGVSDSAVRHHILGGYSSTDRAPGRDPGGREFEPH
jgi:hypothetical protein